MIPVVTWWDWREQKGQSGTNRWAGPQEGVTDSQQVAEQMEEKYGHGQVGRAPTGGGAVGHASSSPLIPSDCRCCSQLAKARGTKEQLVLSGH